MAYRLLRRGVFFPSEGMFLPYKGLERAKFIRIKDIGYTGDSEITYGNTRDEKFYIPLPKKEAENLLIKIFQKRK